MPQSNCSTPPAPTKSVFCIRLHWCSWILSGLVSLALVLIIVPGVWVEPTLLQTQPFAWGGSAGMTLQGPTQAKGPLSVTEYEHGWPWTYARRCVGLGGKGWPKASVGGKPLLELGEAGIIVWWSVPDAWPGPSDASQWNVGALFADTLFALAVVATATAACEWWLRRRGGIGRLRLIGLFVIIGVIAGAISWWRWNDLETRANNEAIEVLSASPGTIDRRAILGGEGLVVYAGKQWSYVGPDWLRRLAGSPEFFRNSLYRIQKLAVDTRRITPKDIQALRDLDDLQELWVRGSTEDLPADLLSSFAFARTERAPMHTGIEIPEYAVWIKTN